MLACPRPAAAPPAPAPRARRWVRLAALAGALLPGCAGAGGAGELSQPGWLDGFTAPPGQHAEVPMPNQVAGGNARDPGLRGRRREEPAPVLDPAAQAALLARRRATADRLWQEAEATRDPGTRAERFKRIGDQYPEVPRAAESRFREGQARVAAGEYTRANEALMEYMAIAPVNPHAAEVEELIYQGSLRDLNRGGGLLDLFRTDENALRGLEYVTRAFPAGRYGDDALLALARYHRDDGDPGTAALHYKELLRRFPDSEWSFAARLELADTYLARDAGDPYRAGFVEVDPRESVPDDPIAKAHAGPVRSALELALEHYELYLERIALDPGRRAEYAAQVAHAQAQAARARQRLAAKDRHVAAFYAARGDRDAAAAYERSAAAWLADAAPPGRRATPAPAVAPAPTRPAPAPPAAPPPRATPAPPVRPPQPAGAPGSGPLPPPVPPPPPPPAWPPTR